LIAPRFKDIGQAFNREFLGMTIEVVALDELLKTREEMVQNLRQHLDDDAKRFLVSFHQLEPNWDALGIHAVRDLPAVRWKMHNLERLRNAQPDRYRQVLRDLHEALGDGERR
jgi:hypothetical protein